MKKWPSNEIQSKKLKEITHTKIMGGENENILQNGRLKGGPESKLKGENCNQVEHSLCCISDQTIHHEKEHLKALR